MSATTEAPASFAAMLTAYRNHDDEGMALLFQRLTEDERAAVLWYAIGRCSLALDAIDPD